MALPGLALLAIILAVPAVATTVAPPGAVGASVPLPLETLAAITVPALPAHPGTLLGPLPAAQPLAVGFDFRASDPSELQSILTEENEATSPGYHHFLSSSDYDALFGPTTAQMAGLNRYLTSYGLEILVPSLGLYEATGTVGEIDAALHVQLLGYRYEGREVWAPASAPTLPSSYAGILSGISGLDTFASLQVPISHPALPAAPPAPAAKPSPPRPLVMGVSLSSSANGQSFNSVATGGIRLFAPPVGVPVTITATVNGTPTAPCTFSWTLGDGTVATTTSSTCTSSSVTHTYVQALNQFSAYPMVANPQPQVTVTVTDSSAPTPQIAESTEFLMSSMSPQWMWRFYNESSLFASGYSGAGMTLGLDEMCDPTYSPVGTALYTNELAVFDTMFGLPAATVSFVGPGAATCSATDGESGWAQETLMDMEWAHAMAPNASLSVYFAVDGPNSASPGLDLDGGDAYWANDLSSGVFLVSNSWALPEADAYSLYQSVWAQAAAEGLTLFDMAGDCGSGVPYNVSFPASDPYGVAVGGTVLQTNDSGDFVQEYVWNGTGVTNSTTTACGPGLEEQGTGGGWSTVYAQPSYQVGMGGQGYTPPSGTFVPRGYPDLSAAAGTFSSMYYDGTWSFGMGTDLATPLVMGGLAVVLDSLGFTQRPVGFLNPYIYSAGNSPSNAIAYHDITMGTNGNDGAGTPYAATLGWDAATGFGTPKFQGLADAWGHGRVNTYWSVSGYVLNVSNGAAISGATVSSGAATTTTSATGWYMLYFGNGSQSLTATATGYNPNSRGVLVDDGDLVDQNISLANTQLFGNAYSVNGFVSNQVGSPVTEAIVAATLGPTVGSIAVGAEGSFALNLLPGNYTLTGIPWGLGYNSSSIHVEVNTTTVAGLRIVLDFTTFTVAGAVESSSGHAGVAGAFVSGDSVVNGDTIGSTGYSNFAGNFFLHLPVGFGTFAATHFGYAEGAVTATVPQGGVQGIVILLSPLGALSNEVDLALRVLAPQTLPGGIPELQTNQRLTLEVWANNSVSGTPQLGSYLYLADDAGGAFSQDNVTVSNGGNGLMPGEIVVNYTGPYLSYGRMGVLVAAVGNPGWTGTGSVQVWLTPSLLGCGPSCLYPVWGKVVDDNGTPLANAQVTVRTAGGAVTNTTVTDAQGIYQVEVANGTYLVTPSEAGYLASPPTAFVVQGQPLEVDLLLNPVAPPLSAAGEQAYQANYDFFLAGLWEIPAMLAVAAVLGIGAVFRFIRPSKDEEEDAKPAAAPPPGGPPGGPEAPMPLAAVDAAGAPLPPPTAEGPPAQEEPWTITGPDTPEAPEPEVSPPSAETVDPAADPYPAPPLEPPPPEQDQPWTITPAGEQEDSAPPPPEPPSEGDPGA